MTSERQIAANRRNAKKSTGPRSAAGKKRTSLNAHSHGGVSMVDRDGEMARRESRQATKKACAAKPLGYDADARAGAVSGGLGNQIAGETAVSRA
jgi:hypothetical protein